MKELILKKGKEKSLLRRHPWIYDTAVQRVEGAPEAGESVLVKDASGRVLAVAAYAPASGIRARCWRFDEGPVDDSLIRERVFKAARARDGLKERTSAVRLVFGEADGIPGLVADRYGDFIVTQFTSCGAERFRGVIVKALSELKGVKGIFDRSDAALRRREGLEASTGVLFGEEPPERIEIVENGIIYGVDVREGHKTGFYIDQRENRRLAQEIASAFLKETGRGMRALNCFCYTGGFSLALLKGGASEVVSVDSSGPALSEARQNARCNGFDGGAAKFEEADVFEYLRRMKEAGESFDLVILDPPKFASNHHQVERAARAYKDINLKGIGLIRPGGTLLTFSCSGAVSAELFQKIVAGAVIDSGRGAWMLGRLGAGEDHPLMMTCPEGEYLKGERLKVL